MRHHLLFRKPLYLLVVLALSITGFQFVSSPAYAATSAIDARYNSDAALRKLLGAPTGAEYSVASGKARNYKWGSLYWTSSTGVHEVHGAIWKRYKELGGPAGRLGFPITDEGHTYVKYDNPDEWTGARNDFQKGALIWTKGDVKAVWISKPFADRLSYGSYPYWSNPNEDERAAGKDGKGGRMIDVDTLMYQTPKGFFEVYSGYPMPNGILEKYRQLGMDQGFMGTPIGNEQYIEGYEAGEGYEGLREGSYQSFNGGRIYQCGNGYEGCYGEFEWSAFEVHGAILWKFDAIGGVHKIGYPVSDEKIAPGGRISYFQRGSIFWNSSTNKTTVKYY